MDIDRPVRRDEKRKRVAGEALRPVVCKESPPFDGNNAIAKNLGRHFTPPRGARPPTRRWSCLTVLCMCRVVAFFFRRREKKTRGSAGWQKADYTHRIPGCSLGGEVRPPAHTPLCICASVKKTGAQST